MYPIRMHMAYEWASCCVCVCVCLRLAWTTGQSFAFRASHWAEDGNPVRGGCRDS